MELAAKVPTRMVGELGPVVVPVAVVEECGTVADVPESVD